MIEKLLTSYRFLWASCQLDQLSRLTTVSAIERALDGLPRGLNSTYRQILSSITPENQTLAVKVLNWLSYAVEPLGLDEIVEAVAIEENSSSLRSLDKLLVPDDILEICGPLIRKSDITGRIELAHASVFQYLTSNDAESPAPLIFQLDKAQSKILLCSTLVRYLSFEDSRNR